MNSKAYFEALGRQTAEGKYVSRTACFLALFVGIVIGALGMYMILPSPMAPPAGESGGGGYKVPLGSAPPQQQQQQKLQQQLQQTADILALENLLTIEPNNVDGWVRLGNLYYDTGQHTKAIEAYEKALALDPGNPDVWVDCGVMYRAHGEFDKALEYFDKALAINSKHEFALFNSGVVLHNDLHDDAKAFAVWEKLATINPLFKAPNGVLLTTILKEHYKDGQ